MSESFEMNLLEIQPSQLYINKEKLTKIQKEFSSKDKKSIGIIPIKKLGGDIIFTDGHTRALAAYINGWKTIFVKWDVDNLDWEMYEMCVKWCKENGIYSIADLEEKIVDSEKYKILWYDRCKLMQEEVLRKRRIKKE